MDVAALRAFVAVCESGSISGASRRLHIAQPALTRRIAGLERAVGHALFERHRLGVSLTPRGARFLDAAVGALEAYDGLLVQERDDATARALRPLRLGLLDEGLGTRTVPIVQAFRQARPDCEIVVVPVERPERGYPLTSRGDLDAIVGVDPPPEDGDFVSTVLYCSERMAAVPRRDDLAAADVLSVCDLLDRTFASLATVPGPLRAVHALEIERGASARYSRDHCAPEIPSLLNRVAAGDVMTFGAGVVDCFRHPQVVYRRVRDATPISTRMAWRGNGHPAVPALARVATALCGSRRAATGHAGAGDAAGTAPATSTP